MLFWIKGNLYIEEYNATVMISHNGEDYVSEPLYSKAYRQFIRTFFRGEAPAICQNCLKRFSDNSTTANI